MVTNDLRYAEWESPLGGIFLLAVNKKLCRLSIQQSAKNCLDKLENLHQQVIKQDKSCFCTAIKQLEEYFQHKRQSFELDTHTAPVSEFQKHTWQILQRIPYGQTRSYKWVAQQLNKPKASRAIGMANKANPLPIIIPCHRVINSSGKLGGYSGGGPQVKKFLLELEGVKIT